MGREMSGATRIEQPRLVKSMFVPRVECRRGIGEGMDCSCTPSTGSPTCFPLELLAGVQMVGGLMYASRNAIKLAFAMSPPPPRLIPYKPPSAFPR